MDRRYIWGAVAAAAVVVAVLVGLSLTGGDDAGELEDVATVQELFAGIPQNGLTVGNPDAPIEIVEFGDLQCPACAQSAEQVVPELIERYVEPGQATLTFRPIAFIGPDSERGAFGVLAAAQQDAAWPFLEVLYHNQGGENSGWLSEETLERTAEALGLDVARFKDDFGNDQLLVPLFREADAVKSEEGVNSTPTFIIRGPEGEETIEGAAGIEAFEIAIAAVGGAGGPGGAAGAEDEAPATTEAAPSTPTPAEPAP